MTGAICARIRTYLLVLFSFVFLANEAQIVPVWIGEIAQNCVVHLLVLKAGYKHLIKGC